MTAGLPPPAVAMKGDGRAVPPPVWPSPPQSTSTVDRQCFSLERPLSTRHHVRRWTRLDIDLFHPADIVLIVSFCLAYPSRVEEHLDQVKMRLLVIPILLEQAQRVLCCGVGVTRVA